MEVLCRHLISPSLWQHKHTSQSLPKLSGLLRRGRLGGVCLSPVFWQCEKQPSTLPRTLCMVLISMETTMIPTGTSVFPPHQYAVGYSQRQISCCDSSSTVQNTRYSILSTAQWWSWWHELQHFTSWNTARKTQGSWAWHIYKAALTSSKTPNGQFFPKNFLCSSLCSHSLKVILAHCFFKVFYAK